MLNCIWWIGSRVAVVQKSSLLKKSHFCHFQSGGAHSWQLQIAQKFNWRYFLVWTTTYHWETFGYLALSSLFETPKIEYFASQVNQTAWSLCALVTFWERYKVQHTTNYERRLKPSIWALAEVSRCCGSDATTRLIYSEFPSTKSVNACFTQSWIS